jgi:hypothetical protein
MTVRSTLSPGQLSTLREQYPELPPEYFQYLATVGWGETPSDRMIYEGPVESAEVYGEGRVAEDLVLLGDDMQGYCLAFHRATRLFGEVDPGGRWLPWPEHELFSRYVRP